MKISIEPADPHEVILATNEDLVQVGETTMYPGQFPIYLKRRFNGRTVAEVAAELGTVPEHVIKLLAGHWRPTKDICKRLGLVVVYAIP